MPDTIDQSDPNATPKALPAPEGSPSRRKFPVSRRALGTGAAIALLIAGGAVGAGGTRMLQRWQPQNVMLLQTAPIDQMKPYNVVAVKGEVAEVFGNKFVVQDGTGRALIDTGPRGEDRPVAVKGETLTVQGRFDRGVVHAQVVAHADGRNEASGPPHGGPKDGPKGPKGPRGPKDGPGPRAERDAPPPPPPGDRPVPDDGAPPPPAR